MKTTRNILILTLCLLLLTGCGTEALLGQVTEEAAGRTPAPDQSGSATDTLDPAQGDSATDIPDPAGPGLTPDSDTDTRPQTVPTPEGGYASLTAEQCVTDDWPDPGVLPRIALDCPGADAINQAIHDDFYMVAEDPMWELHYQCAKGAGHILSVVMVQRANDWCQFTPYNLDLSTGQALTGRELLAQLQIDEDELSQLEQTLLGDEFTRQFGDVKAQTDPSFYDQQYARTTAADNAELDRLWFSGDGQLCFVGRIYGLAGAEYYEYQLSTGWTF